MQLEAGSYRAEWFPAATGRRVFKEPERYEGGPQTFYLPFEGDTVLLLTAADRD